MNVHYVSCFTPSDHAEQPLLSALRTWRDKSDQPAQQVQVADPGALKQHLEAMSKAALDVLILGGHGHPSMEGFWVRGTPLRWHDLAFLLRGALPRSCTFVFYSCNGGYPGIMHIFGRDSGPDYVFGPRISVYARAMTHATMEILKWKEAGGGDSSKARVFVDTINTWAATEYSHDPDHQQFLRVIWCEGSNCRHPDKPSAEIPNGSSIPLLGWGLDS